MKSTRENNTAPPKLNESQLHTLARAVAITVAGDEESASGLMLLMAEITQHPFDHSYTEAVAAIISSYIFMYGTTEHDQAESAYITREREKLQTMVRTESEVTQ